MFASSFQPKNDGGTGNEVDRDKKTHKVKKSKLKSDDVESSKGPVGQVIFFSKHHKFHASMLLKSI